MKRRIKNYEKVMLMFAGIGMGWRTKEEKELFDIAYDVVNKKTKILHLEYQKNQIENKLETFKSE